MDDQTEQRMNQLTEQLEGLDRSRADVCAQICTVYGHILTEMERALPAALFLFVQILVCIDQHHAGIRE